MTTQSSANLTKWRPFPPVPFLIRDSRPSNAQFARAGETIPLRRPGLRGLELSFVNDSCLQPFMKHGLVHQNMGQQAIMADPIKACFDVSFKNKGRTCTFGEQSEKLRSRIRRGGPRSKSLRVPIRPRFLHRVQRQQMKRLHGSVFHGGDAKRPHLAVVLRYKDPSERLGVIPILLQGWQGQDLRLRGGADYSIHSRGCLSLVFRHPFHGQKAAGNRACQKTLQVFDLAPVFLLRRLHNALLESFYHLLCSGPVNLVPLRVGAIGQRRRGFRHLRQPFSPKDPEEFVIEHQPDVSPLSRQGTGPYPDDYRRALAFSGIFRPHVPRPSLRSACLSFGDRRTYGISVFLPINRIGLGPACSPEVFVSTLPHTTRLRPTSCHFGSSRQQLGLVKRNDVYWQFRCLGHTAHSSTPTACCWQPFLLTSRLSVLLVQGRVTFRDT